MKFNTGSSEIVDGELLRAPARFSQKWNTWGAPDKAAKASEVASQLR